MFYFYKDADDPVPEEWLSTLAQSDGLRGSAQVGLMRRLFEQRPWYKMTPDQSVIASGQVA